MSACENHPRLQFYSCALFIYSCVCLFIYLSYLLEKEGHEQRSLTGFIKGRVIFAWILFEFSSLLFSFTTFKYNKDEEARDEEEEKKGEK